MYIETDKILGRGFNGELIAAGVPLDGHISVTSRRVVDGKVVKGFPTALHFPNMDESYRDAIQAVIDAHVPFFGHVTAKIAEVKAEANRRILDRMPDYKQRNYIAFNLEMERKERKGEVLTPTELATIAFTEGEWEFAKAIRSASNVIEAEIALLTDAEAGVFDVANHPSWNV